MYVCIFESNTTIKHSLILFVVISAISWLLRIFLLFYFDPGLKPRNENIFYFYHRINIETSMKLAVYFVKTGFNKLLKRHFFVINFFDKLFSIYFWIFHRLKLFIIKLVFWKNYSIYADGFYTKHNQNRIIFLAIYNSPSIGDMK